MQRTAQRLEVGPGEVLEQYYEVLLRRFGPQGWWPARTRLEVILGAILTQNTAWQNAVLALKRLRASGFLQGLRLSRARPAEIERCIRPAGYFRQKTRTICMFIGWLQTAHQGSLDALFAQRPRLLRNELLKLRGLGPETVDAILLYAGKLPYFVADAYTRRILSRHALVSPDYDYAATQQFLHQYLPRNEASFNEFHALLVEVGKQYCKRQVPRCEACPLQPFLPQSSPYASHQTNVRRRVRHIFDSLPRRKDERASYVCK